MKSEEDVILGICGFIVIIFFIVVFLAALKIVF